jgi:DNA-binding IclR family transcriptional regulator
MREEWMLGSVERVLQIVEALAASSEEGATPAEICAECGLARSTVYRLLAELEAAGYVYRAAGKQYFPNFTFARQFDLHSSSPEIIRETCASVCALLETASEIILRQGQNLLWHHKEEHPLQPIRLRAHAGYIRGANELDSISRMALAYIPLAEIEARWDIAGFFETGVAGEKLSWQVAKSKITAVDPAGMEYDLQGNAKGIRRFCVAVAAPSGELTCLLTVAEAAIPVRDVEAHIENVRRVLMTARDRIYAELPSASGRSIVAA